MAEIDAVEEELALQLKHDSAALTRVASALRSCKQQNPSDMVDGQPRIQNYCLWQLQGVTQVSKHSAIFHLVCRDKKRGTPHPRGRGTVAEPKTWHTTLLAHVGKNNEGPLPWIERDYTPISSAKDWESGKCDVLIKIYADGAATAWLAQQSIGCGVWLSQPVKTLGIPGLVPDGPSFRPASVLLVLAGTGIVAAPQVLHHRDPIQKLGFGTPSWDQLRVPIDLVFSCRKDDILMVSDMIAWCRDQNKGLRRCIVLLTEPQNLTAVPFPDTKQADDLINDLVALPNARVLPSRLSQELLADALSTMLMPCRIVVSGPAAFNATAKDMLDQCNVSRDAITILSA